MNELFGKHYWYCVESGRFGPESVIRTYATDPDADYELSEIGVDCKWPFLVRFTLDGLPWTIDYVHSDNLPVFLAQTVRLKAGAIIQVEFKDIPRRNWFTRYRKNRCRILLIGQKLYPTVKTT